MKSNSKKTVILILIAVGVLASSFAMAADPVSNVANTKHNFAVGANPIAADGSSGVTQVCIFCHTPHNAGQSRLLWNKAGNAVVNFRMYTSSASLTNTVRKESTLPAGSPSLLCLGCHDGKTAMNILHNSSAGVDAGVGYPAGSKVITFTNGALDAPYTMPNAEIDPTGDGYTYLPSMNIGGPAGSAGDDLTNDHPIGFSYQKAYDQTTNGGLHSISDLTGSKIRFFGPDKRVECSSCHNPHLDASPNLAFAPFLVQSNANSALCLACHNK